MNARVTPIHLILLLILLSTLVACGRELESGLPQIIKPSATLSASPTREPPRPAPSPTPSASATEAEAEATREPTATTAPSPTTAPSSTPVPAADAEKVSSFSVLDYTGEDRGTPSSNEPEAPTRPPMSTTSPTIEPETVPAPTATSIPQGEPDAMAIIEWQKLDLPDNFHAIYAQDFGVEKGATAVQFTDTNGEPITIPIENSFVFMDETQTSFIFGYTYILSGQDLRSAFAAKQDDLDRLKFHVVSPALIDLPEIGDVCGGYTGLLSDEERIESVDFLIGEVAASVLLRYPEDQPPPIDIVNLAQVYADSLLNPKPRCEFVSIRPVEGSYWPAYEFEARGFFPREQRIVELSGNVQQGEEILTLSWNMLGQTGETSDQNGRIIETITSGPLLEGIAPTNSDMTLTVTGGFSGCEVTELLPWSANDSISDEGVEHESNPIPVPTIDWDLLPLGNIAYQAYEPESDESLGIRTVNLYTGEVDVLTQNPAAGNWFPEWSPDGSELLFSTDADAFEEEIYLLKSDGAYVRLTDNLVTDTHAVWSPDGSEIAFVSDAAGNMDVYLMELESGEISQLTEYEGLDWFPSWSPDGRQIVFESDRDGNYELYKINRDGSALVRLTYNDATDTSPAWSPDGDKIAFNSTRSGIFQIYTLNLASGEIVQLTDGLWASRHPAWSPHGLFIAYDSTIAISFGTEETDETSNIYVMKADGSDQRQVTDDPAHESYPTWTGERAEFEKKPYWHRPFCAVDTDGDYFPDAPAETWSLDEELYYVVFNYRNMEDGMEWSHAWKDLNSDAYSIIPAVWDGGKAGAKTIYSNLPGKEPTVWEIEFRLEGELMDIIQCPVVK
jgi:Tol biopolymer transport system component